MQNITDEQFQRLLDGIEQSSGPGLFDTFFDPTLLPENGEDGSFLCFPPLPPIEEEVPPISDVPPLEEDGYASSIATSAPGNDQALSMATWIKHVTETLKNLGCMLEEPPASATDGEFDIKVFDRSWLWSSVGGDDRQIIRERESWG
ncbi:hypothetical protein F1880_007449 [Penicillium rolfsii]|nr:hypothetical protein F1880_007449 [Penicillium rolfsii]